jgi:predicted RNase H-like HicB family nuclease
MVLSRPMCLRLQWWQWLAPFKNSDLVQSKGVEMATPNYTAVIRRDGPWWIGWVEEIPGVNSQGATRDELLANLREALSEALEMNREAARSAAGAAFEEVAIQP